MIRSKHLKFLVIVFINLILIELILRLVGFSIYKYQNFYRSDLDKASNILVLGESTTFGSDPSNWTKQLEKKLQDAGHKFNIQNKAEPGTNTTFLWQRLPEQIEKYQPKIVISMMGINDSATNIYFKQGLLQNSNPWLNLRIVKLAHFIYFYFNPPVLSPVSNYTTFEQLKISAEIKKKLEKHQFDEAHRDIIDFLKDRTDEEKIYYYTELVTVLNLIIPLSLPSLIEDSIHFVALFKDIQPLAYKKDYLAHLLLFRFKASNQNNLCIPLVEDFLKKSDADIPSDATIRGVFDCLQPNSPLLIQFRDRFMPEILIAKIPKNPVQNNYEKFYELLHSQKICWIIVQYPLQDVQKMKDYFSDEQRNDPTIIFVSNEENFISYLENHQDYEIFTDHFGGNFGHTTAQGHKLIAEQVYPKVIELLKNKNCSPD